MISFYLPDVTEHLQGRHFEFNQESNVYWAYWNTQTPLKTSLFPLIILLAYAPFILYVN